MEKRKIIEKNESKSDPKYPVTIYFFNRPYLLRAFNKIAEEKGIPVRKLILSFAALGLKAYLKETGQAFKEDRYLTPEEIKERGWDKIMQEEME